MATVQPSSTFAAAEAALGGDRRRREEEREKLRTSRFDLVSSFLVALIGFIGIFFAMLAILWLTSRWTWTEGPIEMPIENPAGRGENAEGFERDFEPPGEEEVEDLLEPTLADTIEAVTDAVSSVAASLVSADTNQAATTVGKGGMGDSRPPGPEGEGDDIVPRFERWQLEFESKDIDSYAKQLDFYKIELGVLGGGVKGVEVASNVSTSPKKRVILDTKGEKRLYFRFNRPTPLQKFDQTLLGRAGARLGAGRTTLKFIPKDLEAILATIELEYAREKGHNTVKEIAKTVFKSQPEGSKYAFKVISQRYRKPRF